MNVLGGYNTMYNATEKAQFKASSSLSAIFLDTNYRYKTHKSNNESSELNNSSNYI
jgi:hypothetical protein